MSETNFLIGRGELLTYDVKGPKRGGDKAEVYTFTEARQRILPQLQKTAVELAILPSDACPRDFGVAMLTLNPSYIAKSYFPTALLRTAGLEAVGSRTVKVRPEKWSRKGIPTECSTTQLFVAGKRSAFKNMVFLLGQLDVESDEAIDFAHIEKLQAFSPEERVRKYGAPAERFFEVGLHLLPDESPEFIQQGFEKFSEKLGVQLHMDLSFQAGNLWFVPVEGNRTAVEKLALFVFVRVIRPVPKLRGMRPVTRSASVTLRCRMPEEVQPLSLEPRVAILDGGLPAEHPIERWIKSYRQLDLSAGDDVEANDHGLAVTSAFLFGPLLPGSTAPQPYALVDHVRVIDGVSDSEDSLLMYRTLGFVEEVLLSRQYEFINLSLGPDLPVEDADVHAWTSVIDDLLSDGNTFMTVAVGNNGERDRFSGNARVQVPADCVNAVAVGAANSVNATWARAPYSAIGPGRSPGVMKPDLIAFGGDSSMYFHVLTSGPEPLLAPQMGTSIASPNLLRSAVGMRAILGGDVTPLALKALLVHGADPGLHDKLEVGWGKIPEELMAMITCPPGVARVVYQGELKPGKYLRAALPMPTGGLSGKVRLKATFCYACPTDPQDASAYTRAGLDVIFRPHAGRLKEGKAHAETKGFFDMKKFATEEERRSDLGKWETVLHGEKSMFGTSLHGPVFDIHYNAREGGGRAHRADKIRYALVLTLEAPKHTDLYNDILRTYSKVLTPISPQVSVPIRI